MDTDRSIEINNLARELLRSGAAASSADAHSKAEGILSGVVTSDSAQATEESTAQRVTKSQPLESAPQPAPTEDRVLRELQFIKAKFNELIREFNSLTKEVGELKLHIRRPVEKVIAKNLGSSQQQSQAETPKAQPQTSEKEATPQQPAPEQKKKPENPRSGGYSSDDVALEKIFYYGNK